ncbi:phage tail-like protein [Neolewinella xylanilytica]|uniref:Phage tail-like protein n=1 Tax=Neolewinella xylanilytica TaxID=1514080 RepID=A0A2S6I8V7_9BACT|nr:phage tail protein [Neolewinella xylanilytica]PPK87925.1 phage tail-like protein [Neolewinella xylanilytica]
MANLPLLKFSFLLEWGGERVGFTEVTGLESSTEVIEYREGSSPVASKQKMPGMLTYANITLKRGTIAPDADFYKWFNSHQFNATERRDLTIKLLNDELEPVMTWRAMNCFVVKYTPSEMKADANEIAIETIEVATEGISQLV